MGTHTWRTIHGFGLSVWGRVCLQQRQCRKMFANLNLGMKGLIRRLSHHAEDCRRMRGDCSKTCTIPMSIARVDAERTWWGASSIGVSFIFWDHLFKIMLFSKWVLNLRNCLPQEGAVEITLLKTFKAEVETLKLQRESEVGKVLLWVRLDKLGSSKRWITLCVWKQENGQLAWSCSSYVHCIQVK